MTVQTPAIHIDIVSDVVCPWCIIGFKQLERAAGSMPEDVRFTVRWHPFELNPQMPPQGQDLREHMQQKYGSSDEQSDATRARLAQLGEELGFPINYRDDSRIYNTFRAHQLLHMAAQHGRQTAMGLVLFEAYFTRQHNIDDVDVLVDAAEEAGLPRDDAAAALADARFASPVREVEREWTEQGINAVPAFILDCRYLVSGARDTAFFAQVLNELKDQATG